MKYKYNGQWVDLSIKALDSIEIGCIIQYMGNTIPNGWLECNGASISQSTYPELYNLIGGTLPDFRGRVLVGQDTSQTEFDTLGETGGSKELQEHSHQLPGDSGSGSSYVLTYSSNKQKTYNTGVYTQTAGTGNSGNLQPYAVVKHIIKAVNTTPTMASIVDGYSTSTQDGYSCNYVNGINTYSTDEVDTGKKWIDGKKIYRIVVPFTTGTSTGSWLSENVSISNIDNILPNWELNIKYSTYWYKVPNDIVTEVRISSSSTQLTIEYYMNGAGFAGANAIAIIEYTKTTDNTNTRNLQESRNLVSEEEPIEEPIENGLKDENR